MAEKHGSGILLGYMGMLRGIWRQICTSWLGGKGCLFERKLRTRLGHADSGGCRMQRKCRVCYAVGGGAGGPFLGGNRWDHLEVDKQLGVFFKVGL
ncbi:hypothetical protein C2845_PM11G05150 [Panicum miliaceum]|uniref:Uncharacterized protein n=1 Tax=Panicum miliaceum TaxID=4540 RepID=A0A3L6RSK4_PANMI|nr:hypothetical protein C2845_PM11G05150 [Panicum miliaceum]